MWQESVSVKAAVVTDVTPCNPNSEEQADSTLVCSGFMTTSHRRWPRCRNQKLLSSRSTCPSSAPALVLTGTDFVARAVPRHRRDRSCGRRVSGVLSLRSTVRWEILNWTSRFRYDSIWCIGNGWSSNFYTSRNIILNAQCEEAETGELVACRQDISDTCKIIVAEPQGKTLVT